MYNLHEQTKLPAPAAGRPLGARRLGRLPGTQCTRCPPATRPCPKVTAAASLLEWSRSQGRLTMPAEKGAAAVLTTSERQWGDKQHCCYAANLASETSSLAPTTSPLPSPPPQRPLQWALTEESQVSVSQLRILFHSPGCMAITVTLSSVCSVGSKGQRLQRPAVNALLEIASVLCLSISCLASQPISELEIVEGDCPI